MLKGLGRGQGERGETIGGTDPEGGGEEEIGGLGGGAELIGEPEERGQGGERAENFAKGIVVVAVGEREEGEEGGLEGAKGIFVEGGEGGGFYFAGEAGGEGGGIEEVGGEKESGLEGLAAGGGGGEEGREGREGEGLKDGLDSGGGIRAKIFSKAKANGFAQDEGEDGGRGGGSFFEGEA